MFTCYFEWFVMYVRINPTEQIYLHSNNDTKQQKVKLNNCAGDCEETEST